MAATESTVTVVSVVWEGSPSSTLIVKVVVSTAPTAALGRSVGSKVSPLHGICDFRSRALDGVNSRRSVECAGPEIGQGTLAEVTDGDRNLQKITISIRERSIGKERDGHSVGDSPVCCREIATGALSFSPVTVMVSACTGL